jgi:peptidoglycan/xylan/chitin deacetylase (PgdA/CDA1 family)
LLGKEWSVIPTTRHVVALTFDAGANDAGLAAIQATLRRTGTPATFFLTGNWVSSYPSQARIVCSGFRVGNHSVTHPYFTQLSDSRIGTEVLSAAAKIRAVCGANPAPLFRFPFGDRDDRTIAVVNALGYVPVRWTVDTLGWQGSSGGRSAASVLARILGGAQPGEIVLMHVGSHPTDHSTLDADALPQAIDQLRARGYTFVTLDALLKP